jgi:hypothetical protein
MHIFSGRLSLKIVIRVDKNLDGAIWGNSLT